MSTSSSSLHVTTGAGFAAFHQLVVEDAKLFDQLKNFASIDEFAARAVELGAERGLIFDAAEMIAAVRAVRREWIERKPA